MTQALKFSETTPAIALPLLHIGQSQKEFFINHAMSMIDTVLQLSIEQSHSAPPAGPQEGHAFRITSSPSGDWADHADHIAVYLSGGWHFIEPFDGLQVFDRNANHLLRYIGTWQSAITPSSPTGGSTIDSEARAAVDALILELTKIGLFAP